MAVLSQISAIVANQLGNVQGQLEARVQTEAIKLLSKFSNECPNSKELIRIIKVRNNLLRVINTFQKQSNKLNSIPSKLRPPISAAKIIISLLKKNPIKVAIGTPPNKDFGGLISANSRGSLTTAAGRLRDVSKLLEALEDDLSSIEELLQSVNPSFASIKNTLESVNVNIERCVDNLQNQPGTGDEIKELLGQAQPLENTGSEGVANENYFYKGANGKNYTLAIIQEQQGEGPVPRRIAVAKDNIGVIVLRGQPSFSSDTQVLLDELKFRIDNQLP